jgi:hypothetical protein
MNEFSVRTGLFVWLLFLFVFVLLQYQAILSILFGAIAGLAAGVIKTLLDPANQTTETPEKETEKQDNAFIRAQRRLRRLRFGANTDGELSQPLKGWNTRGRRTLRSRRKS